MLGYGDENWEHFRKTMTFSFRNSGNCNVTVKSSRVRSISFRYFKSASHHDFVLSSLQIGWERRPVQMDSIFFFDITKLIEMIKGKSIEGYAQLPNYFFYHVKRAWPSHFSVFFSMQLITMKRNSRALDAQKELTITTMSSVKRQKNGERVGTVN